MAEGRPVLLDLFCGAGGCTRGYQEAGFYVVGVDKKPQPNYIGDEFHQDDALFYLRHMLRWPRQYPDFAAIHASPPCQAYSALAAMHPNRRYPELIDVTKTLLLNTGLPYVIENVERAPLSRDSNLFGDHGVVLCGSHFGLGVERGYLRRHRVFETSFPVPQLECRHKGVAVGVYGHGGHSGKHRMLYRAEASEAMQIDWMTRDEMTQAVPPAYTRHIGAYLLSHIDAERRVAA